MSFEEEYMKSTTGRFKLNLQEDKLKEDTL